MPKQIVVAVMDVDGVIYNFVDGLASVAVNHLGRPKSDFPPADCWNFFKDQWGLTTKEYLDLVDVGVAEHGLISNGEPFDGAQAGFDRLIKLGVHIHIATHIGKDGDVGGHRVARVAWLDQHGFGYHALDFTSEKDLVAKAYIDEGDTVFALEDNVENYRSLVEVGARAYLLDQAWNRDEVDVCRVSSVLEFAEVVAEAITDRS